MNNDNARFSENNDPPDTVAAPPVMLVDDEPAFADALAFRLRARGIPVGVVYNGHKALAALENPLLEVILLDINMPGLNGLDVLRDVKARRPEVEVVLLTGAADIATAAKGMRRGAGDYLLKPVDFDLLLGSLAKARQRAREHRERLRAVEAGRLMALGALAAGVGHEINNPLQIIVQRAEWLQELAAEAAQGHPDFEEMARTAESIAGQAVRAGAITAQLLNLAQVSCEGTAETNLPELMRKVADAQAERAATLRTAIRVDAAPNLPLLPHSPADMEPVLFHLLRNALDSIEARRNAEAGDSAPRPRHENAPARTAASPDAPPPGSGGFVRMAAFADQGNVRIVVEDTGEGIAPEHAPHIFNPFFSTRPVGRGAGLGLTVCHSIVAALRGRLAHAPAAAGGEVFTVEIPAAREEERVSNGGLNHR